MSDEKQCEKASVLADVPDELRPFARAPANSIVQPGDDPHLDAAVAHLRDLHGGEDPLFYDVKEDGSPGEPRGIGNARVYVPPVRLAGARDERGRARKRSAAIGVVAGLALGATLLALARPRAEQQAAEQQAAEQQAAERLEQAAAAVRTATGAEAMAAARGTAAVERTTEAAVAAMADSGAATIQGTARSDGPVGSAGNASARRRPERAGTITNSATPPAAPERNQGDVTPTSAPERNQGDVTPTSAPERSQGDVTPTSAPEPARMPPPALPAATSKRLFGAES